jgi:hypothetical protein
VLYVLHRACELRGLSGRRLYELVREIERRFKRVPSDAAGIELPMLPCRLQHAQQQKERADRHDRAHAWALRVANPIKASAASQPMAPSSTRNTKQQHKKMESSADADAEPHATARGIRSVEATPRTACGRGRAAYLSTRLPKVLLPPPESSCSPAALVSDGQQRLIAGSSLQQDEHYLTKHTMSETCMTAYTPLLYVPLAPPSSENELVCGWQAKASALDPIDYC